MFLLLLISILHQPASSSPQIGIGNRAPSDCLTKSAKKCVFPFIYKGEQYTKCTFADSSEPWCATEVDNQSNVVTNRWEDCDTRTGFGSFCPVEERSPSQSCSTVSGPQPAQSCVFPFKYKGRVYRECTKTGMDLAWCSTRTDTSGNHVAGFYGVCATNCPGSSNPTFQSCLEGESWVQGCTRCTCTNGQTLCNENVCSSCIAGRSWSRDCNTCICTADGRTVCTEKSCNSGTTPPPANRCITQSGPSAGKQCVFPFKWAGQTYTSCATWIWGGDNQGQKWCSTKTDLGDNHVNGQGEYGFCPQTCNQDDSVDISGINTRIAAAVSEPKDTVFFPQDDNIPT